jgi:hypothetical protein
MARPNRKPALLIVLTMISIISAHVILNTNYLRPDIAVAEIRDGTERTANASTGYSTGTPVVANDPEGNFVSVWRNSGMDGDGDGIFMQRFDRFGTRLENRDMQVNTTSTGNQSNPDIAMDKSGNYVIVWQGNGTGDENGIYARAFKKDGTAISPETRINTTDNTEILPKVAIDYDNDPGKGSFVVVWESDSGEPQSYDIYAQRCAVNFNDNTSPITRVSDEINVTDNPSLLTARTPVIAMTTNGDFIIAWGGRDTTWSTSDQGWFQAYDKDGSKVGTYTKVTSSAVLSVTDSPGAIAVDKKTRTSFGGNFILVATVITEEFPNGGIFARQINCAGSSCVMNPVALKVFTGNRGIGEDHPSVDSDFFGNFTVTWQGYSATDNYDIYAQSYSWNDGLPLGQLARVGSEFRVNTTTDGPQETPSISINGDGQYTIVFANDTTSSDIRYQMYVSDLFKEGTETLAHPASTVNQYNVDTAVAPNGYHAATWVNAFGPRGIFFTLWDENNNVIAQNVRVDSDDPSNVDDNPSISFYKDIEGSEQGRFIITWSGVAPECAGTASGLDVLYREINPSGEVQGGCESRVDDLLNSDQTQPDVSAGYYNNDGGNVEDTFILSYFDQSDTVKKVAGTFHFGNSFTYNEIADDCAELYCLKNSVAINPENNHIIYAWDNADDFRDGVFIRQGSAGNLVGPANLQVNPSASTSEDHPDVAFLPNDQFIVVYGKTMPTAQIHAKHYLFNDTGNPTVINEEFKCCTSADFSQEQQYYPKIAADLASGNFIITWSYETGENRIYARFFEYINSGTGGISAFGTPFLVNSTQDGTSTLPAVGMDGIGKVTVAWEGNVNLSTNNDSSGIAIQRLLSPLFTPPLPALQPSAEQVITGGGRTLLVPSSIQFPAGTVSTTDTASVQASIRDATYGGDPIKYVEATDLDGAPFTITATISEDFFLTPPGTTSYIPKTAASIRNWDRNTADTDSVCSESDMSNCVLTINSSSTETSFELSSESEDFATLDTQRPLVNKQSSSEIGKWRFYPEFRLQIPPRTPPGNHTTEIIFTLT